MNAAQLLNTLMAKNNCGAFSALKIARQNLSSYRRQLGQRATRGQRAYITRREREIKAMAAEYNVRTSAY